MGSRPACSPGEILLALSPPLLLAFVPLPISSLSSSPPCLTHPVTWRSSSPPLPPPSLCSPAPSSHHPHPQHTRLAQLHLGLTHPSSPNRKRGLPPFTPVSSPPPLPPRQSWWRSFNPLASTPPPPLSPPELAACPPSHQSHPLLPPPRPSIASGLLNLSPTLIPSSLSIAP